MLFTILHQECKLPGLFNKNQMRGLKVSKTSQQNNSILKQSKSTSPINECFIIIPTENTSFTLIGILVTIILCQNYFR